MAKNNTATGSVLTIPEDLLTKLNVADEKIKALQNTSKNAAKSIPLDFKAMADGLQPLISKLGATAEIVATISKAMNGLDSKTKGLTLGSKKESTTSVNSTADAMTKLNKSLDENQVKWSKVSKEIQEAEKRMAQIRSFNAKHETNLANINSGKGGVVSKADMDKYVQLKVEYDQLLQKTTALRNEQKQLGAAMANTAKQMSQIDSAKSIANPSFSEVASQTKYKDTMAKMREYYKELDKQAKEAEKAAKRKEKADAAAAAKAIKEAEKVAKEKERLEKRNIYNYNTSYKGSMEYAQAARSATQYTEAIKFLTKARNDLNTSDAQYGKKLRELNAAITEMNRKKQQAIAGAGQLRNAHRGLMDTAGQLQRQFALMFSVSQVWGYIKSIAEVRGEFELQQRSLQAIIQNKAKADEVFNKTVALAVQSPFRIKELVSYTKQLAAYRIQTDELYETTKRLADVSAGLGVDMQRLILAYGQVKAAAYLRGTEVRQFTEAGINMYGELQAYFKEVKGEAYTTAQIVDMISKRMVTFEDVEQVFRRITDKGGIFYNMQAIQAETLQGKISNLKDSLDVFLNEMGKNTEGVLKGAINATTWMLRNFEGILVVARALLPVLIAIKVQSMITAASMGSIMAGTALTQGYSVTSALLPTLKAIVEAFKNIGTTFKGLFTTGAGVVGLLVAVAGALLEATKAVWEYYDALDKIESKYVKSISSLWELKNAADSEREALEKLIKVMNDVGFDLDTNIGGLTDEQVSSRFERLESQYKAFLRRQLAYEKEYIKNSSIIGRNWEKAWEDYEWYHGILSTVATKVIGASIYDKLTNWDDAAEDLNDYKDAYEDLIIDAKNLETAIERVHAAAEEGKLSALSNYLVPQLKQNKGETDIDYYMRVYDILQMIKKNQPKGSDFVASITDILDSAKDKIEDYKESLAEVQKEFAPQIADWAARYDSLIKKGLSAQKAAKEITVDIDAFAAAQELDEVKKYALYESGEWRIALRFVADDLKVQAWSFRKQLQEYFNKNQINANIGFSLNFDKSDYSKGIEEVLKSKKELETEIQNIERLVDGTLLDRQGVVKALDWDKTFGQQIERISKEEYLKALKNELKNLGGGMIDLSDKKKDERKQLEIYEERIKLLKDMQKEYEKLTQIMSKEEALQKVMLLYNDEMARTGLSGITSLDKQSVADKVKELAKLVKDFSKKGSANRDANSLQLEIDTDAATKDIEKIKSTVEEKLKQWDIVESLKTEGFDNDIITALFPDAPTSANAIAEYITSAFTGKNGEKYIKAREELEKKVGEKVLQQNEETVQEIIKTYGKALSEVLKVENWYADEQSKILTTIPKGMQQGLLDNLNNEYNKRLDRAKWKDFSQTEDFVKLFDNLDYATNASIDNMVDALEKMKGKMKGLDAETLEQVLAKLQELRKIQLERNPIKTLAKSFKDLKKATNGDERQKALMGISESLGGMKNKVDEINSAFGSFSSMMEGFGVKIAPEVEQAMSGVSQALGGATQFAEAYAKKDPVGMIAGGLETISGIGNTLSAFFGGNDDAKLQREIEGHQKDIERLQRAYDQLKESMDNAWNINRLVDYQNEAIKTIEAQNASLQAMIKAEEDKKETDHDAIEEWQNQIEDNLKLIKEIEGELVEQLGGFGSEQNFKSAAEAFSSAWIDAFNNTEDTLMALKKTMDDYFDNMLKKQLMQRASDKYLHPILEKFDAMFAEGSEGGAGGSEVTSSEIEAVKKLREEQLKGFDEYAHQLMEILGIKPSGSSELSKLQQGIQSITETTGQALESLLNSMRFYVSQQATDVSAIRSILTERLGTITGQSQESPVVSAIENQTAVIREIRGMFSDVFRYGHPKGGAGIKIFMD